MSTKVIIVTGGGRGIGRAICQRFAADGGQVVAASRSAAELHETKTLIENAGGRCHVENADMCEMDDIQGLIEGTASRFGYVDVLVNAAGVAPSSQIEDLEPPVFDLLMSVNVRAIYGTCRAVWPVMRAQGSGVIVNVSSVAAYDPFPGFAAYGASKAWVNAWTKALATEGVPFGIRVYGVAPGAVETRMLRDNFPDFPLEQTLSPEDVAEAVHQFTLPSATHMTGQTVQVMRRSEA